MKIFIFSILVTFLSLSADAQIMKSVTHMSCNKDPLQYSVGTAIKINCPEHVPEKALEKIFSKELAAVENMEKTHPNLASLELFKKTYSPEAGVNYVMFQTLDYGFYVYPQKNGEVEIEQNNGSGCQYKYKVSKKNGKRYCTADYGSKVPEPRCASLISNDPLVLDSNKKPRECDAFIEAMLSCSKKPDACKKIAFEGASKDQSQPRGNQFNKPAPSSTTK